MHALTLARQRLRARLQNPRTPQPVRLAHGLVEDGRTRVLPVLSSALAQDILTRGYDARTLERVYANQPSGDLGPVGRLADRKVLDLPVHEGLRERRDAAVGEMAAAALIAAREGAGEFRLLCAPCGLASELEGLARRLRSRPEVFAKVHCWGVDPDPSGDVLPEARLRARESGLRATFIREDLRRRKEVADVVQAEGPFHLVSCLGVAPQFSLEETADIVRYYTRVLAAGGTLLLDRWEPVDNSPMAAELGIRMQFQGSGAFRRMLAEEGLLIEREHPTGEGGCVLVVARKPRCS